MTSVAPLPTSVNPFPLANHLINGRYGFKDTTRDGWTVDKNGIALCIRHPYRSPKAGLAAEAWKLLRANYANGCFHITPTRENVAQIVAALTWHGYQLDWNALLLLEKVWGNRDCPPYGPLDMVA